MNIDKVIIPSGTKLYRCAPKIEISMRKCCDTYKSGMYFSTYQLQALAMCVEYNKPMKLGIFELTNDIEVIVGKYNFRKLNPDRYYHFTFWNMGLPIYEKECHPDENVSHFDHNMECILGINYDWHRIFDDKLLDTDGEVFLGQQEHINKLKLLSTYDVPLEGLYEVFSKNKFIPNCQEYLDHCIPNNQLFKNFTSE